VRDKRRKNQEVSKMPDVAHIVFVCEAQEGYTTRVGCRALGVGLTPLRLMGGPRRKERRGGVYGFDKANNYPSKLGEMVLNRHFNAVNFVKRKKEKKHKKKKKKKKKKVY